MENFSTYNLSELKDIRELLEYRINELRRHKVDDEYFPPYTDKELNELKVLETNAQATLKKVNITIRSKLDEIINMSCE